MKKLVLLATTTVLLILGALVIASSAEAAGPVRATVTPQGTPRAIRSDEIVALNRALDDEYQAWATYDHVVTDFGPVRLFVNIRNAEATHIRAVQNLFTRYGSPIPPNPWMGNVPHYATLSQACTAGVTLEQAQGPLYDELMSVTTHPDIVNVYRALQSASLNNHLPAFQTCAQVGRR